MPLKFLGRVTRCASVSGVYAHACLSVSLPSENGCLILLVITVFARINVHCPKSHGHFHC
jgi:hypothetical protein